MTVRCIAVRAFEFEAGDRAAEEKIEKCRKAGFFVYVEESAEAGSEDRLRNLMKEHRLTIRELAALLGCSPQAVNNWVNGRRMAAASLEALSRVERLVGSLKRRELNAEVKRLVKEHEQRRAERRGARKLARAIVEKKKGPSVSDDTKLEMAALREQGLHYSAIAQRFGVPTPVAYLAVREVLR